MDELEIEERFEMACDRLRQWVAEDEVTSIPTEFRKFMSTQAGLLEHCVAVCDDPKRMATAEVNSVLYADIAGDAYENSFANPRVCVDVFKEYGDRTAQGLNWIATNIREVIVAAYEKDVWTLLIWIELFLELAGFLSDDPEMSEIESSIKEMIYYFVHDYDEIRVDRSINELVVPDEEGLVYQLLMNADHSDESFLYEYGEFISDNEIKVLKYLNSMSDDELEKMAGTYTEGYKKGFELAGIDLRQKETVEIRYPIGFEPMVKRAVIQFEKMGLKPTFRRRTNTKAIGVVSTPASRQYLHDHRFDDALYLNNALTSERLKHAKKSFEEYKDCAITYAGPAVIETFGEKLFVPEVKKEAPKYTKEQEEVSLSYRRDYMLMQDDYIPGDKRSFTIIAYPIPEIGDKFDDIFKETVRINTLDKDLYQKIHQAIIDALDTGEYVRVKGCKDNQTDMKVMLHELTDPQNQTNFENCLADVNIPVGEVFTSPVLTGTEGTLHVSRVFLNGLKYDDLKITFKDGMITDYECGNYPDKAEGKAYIKENVLHNHESLPIGEFAIGTNTAAYVMGRKYDIEAKLPILIAEKTGPHFAVGDTCYSMSEDVVVHNPDGKEIIAKDNERSILRKTDIKQAYFQCHTDITIPFEELGSISVFTKTGEETIIIQDGRFVLPGTQDLNAPLENTDRVRRGCRKIELEE